MRSLIVAAIAALAIAAAGAANAQEDKAKAAGCMNCHAADTKKVGPSFKDIATKYKGQADAEGKLVGAITSGKGHPAVKASPDDVKAIVKWVLAM
jgi:cytochrome c